MKFKLKAYDILEFGQRKDSYGNPHQEDSLFPGKGESTDDDRLFIVCDGMGGHDAGEVASATVCDTMSRYILSHDPVPEGDFSDQTLVRAVEAAFCALNGKDTGAVRKMGTTMTFLKLHSMGCTIAHIGDSRVYQIRPGRTKNDTEVVFVTEDHSLVNELVKYGEITKEEARNHPKKNVITRAMQPNMERYPKVDVYHSSDIQPGDYFYLCTDGMLENMDDDQLCFFFSEAAGADPEKIVKLISATETNRDNHTAIMVHILDVIDPVGPDAVERNTKSLPVNPQCQVEEDMTIPAEDITLHPQEEITTIVLPSNNGYGEPSSSNSAISANGHLGGEDESGDEEPAEVEPEDPSSEGNFSNERTQASSAAHFPENATQSQREYETPSNRSSLPPTQGPKRNSGISSRLGKNNILITIAGIFVLVLICYFLIQQCSTVTPPAAGSEEKTEQKEENPEEKVVNPDSETEKNLEGVNEGVSGEETASQEATPASPEGGKPATSTPAEPVIT